MRHIVTPFRLAARETGLPVARFPTSMPWSVTERTRLRSHPNPKRGGDAGPSAKHWRTTP